MEKINAVEAKQCVQVCLHMMTTGLQAGFAHHSSSHRKQGIKANLTSQMRISSLKKGTAESNNSNKKRYVSG